LYSSPISLAASEMTYTVSTGALNSTQTKPQISLETFGEQPAKEMWKEAVHVVVFDYI